MLKILLVDDEKLEREGIAGLVDWQAQSLELIGAAKNGVEAYEIIGKQHPDIVITDIKMPVVSGLDLIEKVRAVDPDILFIVLSGYGDYEFTSKAMLFGVRHYLLKPVTEEKILEVLDDTKDILCQREKEKTLVRNLRGNFEKVLPHVKQQFLRDAALTGVYDQASSRYYQQLFRISGDRFRLALLLIDRNCDFIDRFALKNMAEEIIGTVRLNAIIDGYVVLLLDDCTDGWLTGQLEEVQRKYREYFNAEVIGSVSDGDQFYRIHSMYEQGRKLLGLYFELPETRIIFSRMATRTARLDQPDILSDMESIYSHVSSGKISELNFSLEIFFVKLERNNGKLSDIRLYCKKLIKMLLNLCLTDDPGDYDRKSSQIDKAEDIRQICNIVRSVSSKITSMHLGESLRCHTPVVEEMIRCIYENMDNPQLSLGWIAKEILFMNEEYLGRVFFREMHEKFCQFVLRIRLDMAKRLIENTHDLKIYEISRMTGFAQDAQYFSRMFKQYTRYTPTEYKRSLESSH